MPALRTPETVDIGTLGHILFIWSLEKTIELAGCFVFDNVNRGSRVHMMSLIVAASAMCERLVCAPRSEIFFEPGHRLVIRTN